MYVFKSNLTVYYLFFFGKNCFSYWAYETITAQYCPSAHEMFGSVYVGRFKLGSELASDSR